MRTRSLSILSVALVGLVFVIATWRTSYRIEVESSFDALNNLTSDIKLQTASIESSAFSMVGSIDADTAGVLRKELVAEIASWKMQRAGWRNALSDLQTLIQLPVSTNAAAIEEAESEATLLQKNVEQLVGQNSANVALIVAQLLEHKRQFEAASEAAVANVEHRTAKVSNRAAVEIGSCLAVGFFMIGVLFVKLGTDSTRSEAALLRADASSQTQLDEFNLLRKQHADLAREIFTSRRAEEELRAALADMWAVAAKMHDHEDASETSLKAAIPMTPRSRISG